MQQNPRLIPIFTAKRNHLHQAASLLEQHGIHCRHSEPKKAEGILRVAETDAEAARKILIESFQAEGHTLSDMESQYFRCFNCDTSLSIGTKRCPKCEAFVGDPHGY